MFDIQALSKDLKNYLVNAVALPFWYISVYYYFPNIYKQDDFLLIACVCIALTVISNFILAIFILTDEEKDKNKTIFDFDIILSTTLIQCVWLSILIFGGYLFSRFTSYRFEYYGFLLTYFSVYIIFTVVDYIHDKQSKKDKKTTATKQI